MSSKPPFIASMTAEDKFDSGRINMFKFGDPFKVSDIGGLSSNALRLILEFCHPSGNHFGHLRNTHSLETAIIMADEFAATELQAVYDTLIENDVEYFLLRQLG
jgi:hypothetical protein